MGMFFTLGQPMKRPGTYQRYENAGNSSSASTVNGTCAALFSASWGPLNQVVMLADDSQVFKYFGSGGTTKVLDRVFKGGASKVLAVRGGSGGAASTLTLKDTGTTPASAITVTAKYPGARAFSLLLRDSLTDTTKREFILYEGAVEREVFSFALSSGGEVDALIAAAANSQYVTMAKATGYSGTGKLASLALTAMTGGTDPTLDAAAYSAAMSLLEAYRFNAVCIDTNDTDIQAVLAGFVDRVFQAGLLTQAVLGEPTTVAYLTRLQDAAAYNDKCVVYIGSGWHDSATDEDVQGYLAAAQIAGMLAAIAANNSLAHKYITDAAYPLEVLSNSQLDAAIDNGMLALSTDASGNVWIDSDLTTLVSTTEPDDAGWKKIRRVKERFELLNRVSDATAPLNGNVDNDADGRSAVIKAAQGVVNDMIAEKKLFAGAKVTLDAANAPTGDSAWFVITPIDDVDSLEKSYLTFGFRFSAAA